MIATLNPSRFFSAIDFSCKDWDARGWSKAGNAARKVVSSARPAADCLCGDALRQLRFQIALHLGPLFLDDAEDDRVAVASTPHQHVVAQNALVPGTDARNRGARLQIDFVGLQHYAAGVHLLEG